MGLFGRKKDVWTVLFYDGEVPGFVSDIPCDIVIEDNTLIFEQKKTKTKIILPLSRVIGLEILPQKDFMEKYKGNSSKQSGPKRTYYVFNYINKDNERLKMVFWLWNVDKYVMKMIGLRKQLLKVCENQTYEL